MSNPIKASDLYKDDGAIEEAIKQMEALRDVYVKNLDAITKEAEKLFESLNQVNTTTKEGQATTRKAATDADKLKKAQKDYAEALNETNTTIRQLKQAKSEDIREQKLQEKAAKSAKGSYNQLSAEYALAKLRLNAMSKAERESTQTGKKLEAQAKDIYEEMKRLQEATGKHTLSVGDYEKGWAGLREELGQMPGATGAVVGGFNGMSAAAKKFLANPIVLVISLIVGGLAALFSLFKKTKAGSDLLAKGSAALSGIMSALVGFVDKLYKGLLSVFEDPQQAMKDFWEALKKNVVNRFHGLINLVKSLGKAFKALWERDLDGLKKAAGEAGTALIQMNTGLDADQQREFAEAIQETTNSIKEQIKAFADLEAAKIKTRRTNRELEKSLENLITKEEMQKAIADDMTKSFKEREDAAQRAAEFTEKRARLEQQIASSNLALINRELDLRNKNGENVEDLLDQQLDAYKTLKQAQREYLLSVRDNEKRESELKQDRLERDLDILIDGFDNQKTINERIIADDNKTFEERQRVLDETKQLFEDTFRKQIETIQQFTGVQVDANDLIKESDAVVLNQKIRSLGLSEIIEGRLLEIIKERRTATKDLADAETDLNAKREAATKKEYDALRERYDQEYDLRISEIDIMKATEAEKTRLRLEAEKDRLQKIIDLNKSMGGQLSALQIKQMENVIKKIDQEIAGVGGDGQKDIYDMLGLKLDDEAKQGISDATAFAIQNVQALLAARVEAAEIALQKAQEETQAAQSRYEQEIEARNNGYANQVITAQRELELKRKQEEKALKDKQKAQRAQEAIDTAMQISGLITASVQIYKSLSGIPIVGPALAAAAVGIMFATFAASKIKAKSLAKEKFGDGGVEFLEGGSHASGNDIPIGMTRSGKQRTAEGGEAMAIINKNSTKKYRKEIPGIINALNKGTFENTYSNAFLPSEDMPAIVFNSGFDSPDLKQIEDDLGEIRKRGDVQRFIDADGNLVEVYKNVKRRYV